MTLRLSSSSFEAGALTASPGAQTLGAKKRSIPRLGLASTLHFPSLDARTLLTTSSASESSAGNVNVGMPAIGVPECPSAGGFTSSANTDSTGAGVRRVQRKLIIAGEQWSTMRGSLVLTAGTRSSLCPLSTMRAE